MSDCLICGAPDTDRAQIFRGLEYCCDQHRKALEKAKTEKKVANVS